VIGAASVLLGFLLARRLFGPVAAVCAGIMLAGYPYLVYLSALFEYPQTLFILLLAGYFLLYLRFRESQRLWTLFGACLCLGIGVLTMPSTLIFLPVFGLLLLTRNPLTSVQRLAVLGVAMALTIGVWATRNYLAYGEMVLVNSASGWNFWVANNSTYAEYGKAGVVPPCAPGYEQTEYCRDYQALNEEIRRRELQGVERVRLEESYAWDRGLEYLREHPREFVVLAVMKFARLWSPVPDAVTTGAAQGGTARDVIGAATYIPLFLFGVAGLVLGAREHWRKLLPIYAFIIVFVVPFAIFLPTTRYRLPIDFLLAIFASHALARAWAFGRARTRSKLLQAA